MNRFWPSSHHHRQNHRGMATTMTTGVGSADQSYHSKSGGGGNKNPRNKTVFTMIRWFGWFILLAIILFAWKQSLDLGGSSSVDGFFFDKFERLKRIALPSAFGGLTSFLPGLSTGVRVCINFASAQYPQSYQQNTCFLCDAYRFNAIAYQCTGQTQIPSNINFTQANCIMNNCQPMVYGNRYAQMNFGPIGQLGMPPLQPLTQQQQQPQALYGNVQQQPQRDFV